MYHDHMTAQKFVALDLGAESGRAMLAAFDGERIVLEEAHRFANVPVRVLGNLHWDALRLFDDIKQGLVKIGREHKSDVAGIGLDTWGVDFALLGRDDELAGNPFHYRDGRTQGLVEKVFERVPREEVFAQTGIQFLEINSLYQLYAMRLQNAPILEVAKTFLMMPDLFHFWLTGFKACEFTDATTTQCFDPRAGNWAYPLLDALEIPTAMFPQIISPGTVLGKLHTTIAAESGIEGATVIAPACHDTGSAVAGAPLESEDAAWLSSGTWSIVGAEVSRPVINADSLAFNFTNEGGVGGGYRLCKNVMGLWILQECRREWSKGSESVSYAELVADAERAPAFRSLIDPDDELFFRPGDMPARIAEFCMRTGQPIPEKRGEFVRCVLASLALKYRFQLERLEQLLGKQFDTIHMIGGGTQNELLCQFTAEATDRAVIAGPVEATTLGNVTMQMLALGHIGSLAQGRQVIRQSFAVKTYEPREHGTWQEAYAKFVLLVN